ncbi:thioredoxin-dependent thiol peroxidase [Glaesserella parasuis]|uniref:thioredoxin-dependent thiol peroxidase n=1 Tax=Glaesserella parasuis TaxID=738 RepID=UPI001365B3FA|nr:thioredoxin-dependent thiol peroxidase [Glaesserella parasuis]MWQ74431.1 thioredoxin-dependent thiol peroxidase [Glaesserella parasuis]
MDTLKVGDTVPSFSLLDQNFNWVTLEQFPNKKFLIYFYPKALTPGCTSQACGLRDSKEELDSLNVMVLGISPDSPEKLAKFLEKNSLNFILLSDVDHKVAEAFGVWGKKKFLGKSYDGVHRISFLVDEYGKIMSVFNKFKTKEHHRLVINFLKGNSDGE